MEFLYSLNRLNVAVSRPLVMAVLVCSPGLVVEERCSNAGGDVLAVANHIYRFL